MPGQNTLRLPRVDEATRQKQITYDRSQRESHAHHVAIRAAAADRTDPFVYRRVFAHIINGIGEEHGYSGPATKPETV